MAVSNDSVDSHCQFGDSLGGLDFPHVSDEQLTMSAAYTVVNDSGKGCRRAMFVVDREGTVRLVNRAYQVAEESQYQAILDLLAALD